ncbi:hypothetical protein KBY65_10510 [Cyanobium sp. Alchichica 3B3-8F6]|nr:hypothetical protein [Cyanobium sp. Alchichica 3B3-8F6]MCP9942945.1 hypothetical protein [Cyanobium sp. ATX 6E8]
MTLAELAELEATLLPALERHHLRLLAHGLRTLQAISRSTAASLEPGPLPDRAAIGAWVRQQPPIADDAAFQAALVEQLVATGGQLEHVAGTLGRAPLALELADLSTWATRQADRRLGQGETSRG